MWYTKSKKSRRRAFASRTKREAAFWQEGIRLIRTGKMKFKKKSSF